MKNIVLIIMLFVSLPMLAFAQDNRTEAYTSIDGALRFEIPADWYAEDNRSLLSFSNDPEWLNSRPPGHIPPSTIFGDIQAGSWRDIAANLDTSRGVSALGLAQQSFGQSDTDTFTLIEGPTQLDTDADAALLAGTYLGVDSVFVFIVVDDENGIVLSAAMSDGEFSRFREALIAIVDSAEFEPGAGTIVAEDGPAPMPVETPVRWQQQHPNADDNFSFGRPDTVTIASDGTIYVAFPGIGGIRVLQGDGTIIGTLFNSRIRYIDDMVQASDNTLWVRDGSELLNIGSDGNLIASIDTSNTRQDQSYAPARSFDIGPDGNFYIFRPEGLGGTFVGIVQVLDAQGTTLREITLGLIGDDRLSESTLAVSPDGSFYLVPRRLNLSRTFSGLGETQAITIVDSQGEVVASDFAAPVFRQITDQANETDAINDGGSNLAFDFGPDGSIYIATTVGLFVLDSTGTLIAQYGQHHPLNNGDDVPPLEPGEFASIGGISVAPNGDAVMVNSNAQHTQIIRISVDDLLGTP